MKIGLVLLNNHTADRIETEKLQRYIKERLGTLRSETGSANTSCIKMYIYKLKFSYLKIIIFTARFCHCYNSYRQVHSKREGHKKHEKHHVPLYVSLLEEPIHWKRKIRD